MNGVHYNLRFAYTLALHVYEQGILMVLFLNLFFDCHILLAPRRLIPVNAKEANLKYN